MCYDELEEIFHTCRELLSALDRGDLDRVRELARYIMDVCIHGV